MADSKTINKTYTSYLSKIKLIPSLAPLILKNYAFLYLIDFLSHSTRI